MSGSFYPSAGTRGLRLDHPALTREHTDSWATVPASPYSSYWLTGILHGAVCSSACEKLFSLWDSPLPTSSGVENQARYIGHRAYSFSNMRIHLELESIVYL